ncbi:radical SAM protein [Candidatus Margulisiibacteriota bacterium]
MADFCVWAKCNNKCLICSNPEWFPESNSIYKVENVLKRLEDFVQGNREGMINSQGGTLRITGGEPTTHPQFAKILEYIKNNVQEEVNLFTNGRMLAYEDIARICLQVDNIQIAIALHGSNAKDHDAVTQVKGSFKQTIKGIENVSKLKNPSQQLELRIIIQKNNYKKLKKIISFVQAKKWKTDRLVFIFHELEGLMEENLDKMAVRYSQLSLCLQKNTGFFKKIPTEIRFYHFPLCTIPSGLWPYVWRTLPKTEVVFIDKCEKCMLKKYCLGIHKDYVRLFGDKEFKAINKKYKITATKNKYQPIAHAN